MGVDRGDRQRVVGAVAAALLLGGCATIKVPYVGEAVRESFADGMSPSVRELVDYMGKLPYAQLYGRFADGEEIVFILARQDHSTGIDTWVGSGGVALALDGTDIVRTDGMPTGIASFERALDGPVAHYLRGEDTALGVGLRSVWWLLPANSPDWIEQISTIESIVVVWYEGFAFSGPALLISESVHTSGRPGSFVRKSWIEMGTRALLRIETRILPEAGPVVMEWLRVPDRSDLR